MFLTLELNFICLINSTFYTEVQHSITKAEA